jgi:hypothetical protein
MGGDTNNCGQLAVKFRHDIILADTGLDTGIQRRYP